MQIKYVVLCYVQYFGYEPVLRRVEEFTYVPGYEQIEKILAITELDDSNHMKDRPYPAKEIIPHYPITKIPQRTIYSVVEKRFYKERDYDKSNI